MPPGLTSALIVFAVSLAGVLAGVRLTGAPLVSSRIVPFSGGVLIGIGALWILPEIATTFGWVRAVLGLLGGFGLLWLIDRYLYRVCPSCSHTHDHDHCSTRLHGFAAPMLLAAALHSLLDGWTLPAVAQTTVGPAFVIGIALHKLPEGVALGVIVRSAMQSRVQAVLGCAAAEALTVLGALMELAAAPHLGPRWVEALLAVAGGSFLFLGYHAVHAEYRRRGMVLAFMPALTGVAGSTVLRILSRGSG